MSESTAELTELFAGAGVPDRLVPAARAALGEGAAKVLREDPWRLLTLPGIRPDQADYFAAALGGHPAGDPRRGAALVTYLLMRAALDGHTAQPVRTVASALTALEVPEPAGVIEAALDEARIFVFGNELAEESVAETETEVVALARYGLAEESAAEGFQRLMATAEPLSTDEAAADLDGEQQSAVQIAARFGVSVISGPPGPRRTGVIAALTGLAGAVAGTGHSIYRLLEPDEGMGFARGEQRPLEAGVVVVDEAETLGIELAAALVEACADGTHLVLLGDPLALASAAPGRVLADLVESTTVPVFELSPQPEGPIGQLVAAVRGGELPAVHSPERAVVVVPARDGTEAAHRAVQLVTDSIPRALGIAQQEILVVTPVERGAAGATALNQLLKEKLNPGPGFDSGDRVVAVADLPQVAAGEVGTVTAGLEVAFPAGTVRVQPEQIRHGWAMTVRRAHGTRWPAVVAVLPGEAAGALSRPLVYTALSRAERHLSVVHASGPALAQAVREINERPRRTRLTGLLQS